MIDVQSIIVYLGLAVLCFLIARLAELSDDKRWVWAIVLMLSLVAGLRSITVGIDAKNYDAWFRLIAGGNEGQIYGVEAAFILASKLLLAVFNSTYVVFFFLAVFSHGPIIFTLWKNREHLSFPWSVLCYYIMFYAMSLNGMRQFLAVALVIYATNFAREGKYLKFILMVLTATLFHLSALVGFLYLFFEIPFLKRFGRRRKALLLTLCSLMGIGGIFALEYLMRSYGGYFDRQASSIGVMMLVKFGLLALSLFVIGIPVDKEERKAALTFTAFYGLGIALNSLSYIFLYMGRIGLYFYLMEAFFIGWIFKVKGSTLWVVLLKLLYGLFLLYFLYDLLVSNRQGELPYRFLWQVEGVF